MPLKSLAIVLTVVPMVATAADVSSTFHDGLFGVPWGSSLETVAATFPDGNALPTSIKGYAAYWVKDDQTFLGVVREKSAVLFGVDEKNKLSVVAIGYPYAKREELRAVVTKMLGPPTSTDSVPAGVKHYGWTGNGRTTLGATITEDTSTVYPMLWLVIGTTDYSLKAKNGNCVGE